ncbi:MAG TPA: class I SAM-dependent methyltransferase [Ilumatobacteraceae bacterium]|nr:class I SAM-dependent methyltransferase [Ilumatobacteraceae bacterium]
MQGYDDTSYGEAFADVYDEWYEEELGDVGPVVACLSRFTGDGRALELGVGTGRLAIPLCEAVAAHGGQVFGLDTSAAMLARMAAKPHGGEVTAVRGDMVDDLPDGPFNLVFAAYNTFFNLLSEARQRQCMAAVAQRLVRGGRLVIEAFVPSDEAQPGDSVSVKALTADRVVLSASRTDPARQVAEGQYIQFTEAGGVRLRPWAVRWATPAQLDHMAAEAGLALQDRWADFEATPFDAHSTRHVSVYGPTM